MKLKLVYGFQRNEETDEFYEVLRSTWSASKPAVRVRDAKINKIWVWVSKSSTSDRGDRSLIQYYNNR